MIRYSIRIRGFANFALANHNGGRDIIAFAITLRLAPFMMWHCSAIADAMKLTPTRMPMTWRAFIEW